MTKYVFVSLFLFIAFCGDSEQDAKDQGPSDELSGFVPAAWNGAEDWDQSPWKVVTP